MKTKSLFISSLCLLAGAFSLSAQVAESNELAYKIKDAGFKESHITELSQYMTDYLGSRLASSQMKRRAEQLMVEKLKEYGFSNVHIEKATDFSRGGWDVEKTYAAMTAPYYCAFSVNPKAWTGSTNGLVKGECIIIEATTKEDLEKYRGKLAGKIVLMPVSQEYTMSFEPLATRYTNDELAALKVDQRATIRQGNNAGPNGGPGAPPPAMGGGNGRPDMSAMMARRQLQNDINAFIKAEKPLCIVNGRGAFNVPSATGVSYKAGDPEPTPEVIMPIEDHGRMVRLIQAGQKVEMELELKNKFTKEEQVINNVIAEIPGTDPKLKAEIVLLGGHLDSWHGGTGGADNASGCIVMIEAMRILNSLGIKPKRTIRLALWGGEEVGLYGSSGYASSYLYDQAKKKTLPGYDKFALYLNMDNGSGRFRGIFLENNDLAVPFFTEWMKAVESLGFSTLTLRTTGSTDHVSFQRLGLPAYQFLQDELEYDRTYHTIMDTYERLSLPDLTIDACITAWLSICAANDPNKIPVKPGYPEVLATQQQRPMF